MMLYKCKECDDDFNSERGLHAHLKKHKISVADYYSKHFPRFDLYTNKPLKFKSVAHYFTTNFNSMSNFRRWCEKNDQNEVKEYLVKEMQNKTKEKGLSYVMGSLQLQTYGWPDTHKIKQLFGSYREFCRLVGQPPQFGTSAPKSFYADHSKAEIWIDTREKKPLDFINPTKKIKLDSGDYTVGGDAFSHTFVDRKSAADFVGTMTQEPERFKREIQRCADIGGYMFIVVDASVDSISAELAFARSRTNIQHVWHNMREILNEFAGDCQFVFSGGRAESSILIPKLLICGQEVWKVDIQHYVDEETL